MLNSSDVELRSPAALVEETLRFFREAGFREIDEEPVIPRSDTSVLFSNATITPLKDHLRKGVLPSPGFVLAQRCLRLQNLRHFRQGGPPPEYMSHFRMVGILAPVDEPACIKALASDFLREVVRVREERLEVAAGALEQDLVTALGLDHAAVRQLASSLTWRYGMDGFTGRGVDLGLVSRDGVSRSFGQVVEISRDGRRIAFEFGFGAETLAARLNESASIFAMSELADFVPFRDAGEWLWLMDAISVTALLLANGVAPGRSRRGRVARKILNLLPLLADRCGVPQEIVTEWVVSYATALGADDCGMIRDQLARTWLKRLDSIRRLHAYIESQVHLTKVGLTNGAAAQRRAAEYGESLGQIGPEEVLSALQPLAQSTLEGR